LLTRKGLKKVRTESTVKGGLNLKFIEGGFHHLGGGDTSRDYPEELSRRVSANTEGHVEGAH